MTVFDDMVDDIFQDSDFGQVAQFKPQVGSLSTCYVWLEREIKNQPFIGDGQAWERATTVEYRLNEIGVEADKEDMFIIGSVEYTVMRVLDNDGLTVTVEVIESYD